MVETGFCTKCLHGRVASVRTCQRPECCPPTVLLFLHGWLRTQRRLEGAQGPRLAKAALHLFAQRNLSGDVQHLESVTFNYLCDDLASLEHVWDRSIMLAPNPFSTVTTSEASQKAEELPEAEPFGGEEVCAEVHSLRAPGVDGQPAFGISLLSLSPFLHHAYSCHVCGFETELNVQFVSHMSLHVDKEQWMFSICCTACDFVTMEEAEIKAHIGTKHTGDHSCQSISSIPAPPDCLPPAPAEASSSSRDTDIPSSEGRTSPR